MRKIAKKVQINIPFGMLWDKYVDTFLKYSLNPEIGIDAAALDRFSRVEFSDMARQLLQRGLCITIHGPFFDRFQQLLDVLPLYKPKTVVCHAGYEWKRFGFVRQVWIENSIEMWGWLGENVKAAGSHLMLENVYEKGPGEIRVLLKRLTAQSVGFCLDTGHQSAFGREPLTTWLDSLHPFLGQVHLHDNHGIQDEHMALGHGKIDFEMLFRLLKARQTTPPVITLEPHQEDALEPSLDYLEKIWPWQ